ncbi:transcriptional regulator, TetR family [Streptomyces sp. DvalAA-14]|uniref:TetR/AcrR family transcriptional regulator n=1 Tax=unclassified Streptomyces TaxID=2593676 RepID=UPI00081B7255|nr:MULTISPECIES: TetR/AcrR family transcriptional regulator [unclassified Streptomyces]MYS21763.1 TetR family transcriptional regulator [Streptomyces sp. SID4948]SCE00826.1 transcriptional regulator, TetR family [Streptomyces sp. DvalAA-14]
MASTEGRASGPGLRELTRRAVTAEIAAKAGELFAEQGFEETTVDQIAEAVGISARSVFRYFVTKEDMAVGGMIALGHEVAAAFAARPADEEVWVSLRRALDVCVDAMENEPGGLRRATMLAGTPALRAAIANKHLQWQEALTPYVRERVAAGPAVTGASLDLRTGTLVSAALACLDAAALEWTRVAAARPLGALLDAAMATVRT